MDDWRNPLTKVLATGQTYEHREALKRLGFRWDGIAKEWWRVATDQEIDPLAEDVEHETGGECQVRCEV